MTRRATFGDFRCSYCGVLVPGAHVVSGVNNRNHCPYCLWSRHLDLLAAGDRLSACKAPMQPIALTLKRCRNKYGSSHGELMLVHLCSDCGSISINRIAADDDARTLMGVFTLSSTLTASIYRQLGKTGIDILGIDSLPMVHHQLFGQKTCSIVAQPA